MLIAPGRPAIESYASIATKVNGGSRSQRYSIQLSNVNGKEVRPGLIGPGPIGPCPTARKMKISAMLASIQIQFGKSVRRLRIRRKLSQEKLAELAGLHPTYLGRIERGRQNISLANIGKIARALKVKPLELFRSVH